MSDTTTALSVLGQRAELSAMASSITHATPMLPSYLQRLPPPERTASLLAILMTGAELGMPPMQAIRSLHLVEGRVVLAADAQLALALSRGVAIRWERTDAECASLTLSRGGSTYTSTWTMEDAKMAGLTNKNPWKAHPKAMLRARAITSGIRAFCPDVLGGQVYSLDEVDDIPPEPPRRIVVEEVQVVSSTPTPPAPPTPNPEVEALRRRMQALGLTREQAVDLLGRVGGVGRVADLDADGRARLALLLDSLEAAPAGAADEGGEE